jgi:hypothetical protein
VSAILGEPVGFRVIGEVLGKIVEVAEGLLVGRSDGDTLGS